MSTVRYKVTLAYRGTRYHGWQRQPAAPNFKGQPPPPGQGIPTIQEVVARTLASVLGHPVNLIGASRTDAGVHAKGQIAHFDTERSEIPPHGLMQAVNHRLPSDILIRQIEAMPPEFHAIRWVTRKRYQYFIWNAEQRPLFFPDLAWHRRQTLDIAAMADAARHFVGEHDFASFAKPGHGRTTTIRTIYDCTLHARGPRLVFGIEGNGFLWNMVRIIVGTLMEVGLKRYSSERIPEMLTARDRRASGPTAPPRGLFLHWIACRSAGEDSPPILLPPTDADEGESMHE